MRGSGTVNAQHGSRSEVVRAGVDRTARSANFASKFEDVSERKTVAAYESRAITIPAFNAIAE